MDRRGQHFPAASPKSWMSQKYFGVDNLSRVFEQRTDLLPVMGRFPALIPLLGHERSFWITKTQ